MGGSGWLFWGTCPGTCLRHVPEYVLKHVPNNVLRHMLDKHVLEHVLNRMANAVLMTEPQRTTDWRTLFR